MMEARWIGAGKRPLMSGIGCAYPKRAVAASVASPQFACRNRAS